MMKKSILVASLLLAGGAMADSTEIPVDGVLGVMPISVPAGKTDVIVSVPWVGATNDMVAVSNLVKTAGLTPGNGETTISLYNIDETNFTVWNLETRGGINHWVEANEVSSDTPVAKQGESLILSVTNGLADVTTFYVVGHVGTNRYVQTTIKGAKDSSTPTYNLLAPPCATNVAVNVNEFFKTIEGSIHNDDQIVVDTLGSMTLRFVREYDDEAKAYKWVNEYGTTVPTIPAGRGFWYKRCHTSDLTITWEAPYVSIQ